VTFDEKTLYELLPAIYRIRDAELGAQRRTHETQEKLTKLKESLSRLSNQESSEARELKQQIARIEGGPLRSLMSIIAEQARVVEENLAQLYDDQFAETCAPWVLPYLGDLIGITGLPSAGLAALNPRAEVGHTIGYRRRKGTAAVMEQLGRDVTRWPARAVEFFQLLATTQYLNHLRPENQSFISVRGAERLEYLGGAFEHLANGGADLTHTVDVRRIASGRGRYNIPNVGIFLWRLGEFSLTSAPAAPAPNGNPRCLLFNPLSCDLPLFNKPVTEDQITHLAEPINVPDRIRRRVMNSNLKDYYGDDKSVLLELANPDIEVEPEQIPVEKISVCDLSGWINLPKNKIAIDPVLGRIALPSSTVGMPDLTRQMLVTFYYGFSDGLGGGEYNRLTSFGAGRTQVLDDDGQVVVQKVVNTYLKDVGPDVKPTISDALGALSTNGGAVEILNSGRYLEHLSIDATSAPGGTGKTIIIRAADKHRPTLVLTGDLEIKGGKDDLVILDGLLIVGGAIKVAGAPDFKFAGPPPELGRLQLRHCTLVPGISLDADGKPTQATAPSLVILSETARVEIDHCILGGIRAAEDAEITIRNSIVDATAQTNLAYGGIGGIADFGAPLHITNSTVIGRVRTSIMRLASNTIFLASLAREIRKITPNGPVIAKRRQEGCVRFSYLSPGALVPVRYHCQPEPDTSLIRPRFVSTHFNDPAYCQLSASCPSEIRRGADDEAAMGVFHDLYEPQREDHLRARLDEYLRFGLEAGLFFVT
jgi:hypothetical protein